MVEDGNRFNSACTGDCVWCLHTKADDCAIIFLVMYQNEDKTNSDEVEMQDHIIKGNRSDHILILVWIHSLTTVNSNQLSVLLIACVFYLGSYDSCNSGHVFPVRHSYIFAKTVLLKLKSNYTAVRFVVFGYMLLVFIPLRFWKILIYSIYIVFHIKNFHTWVFYMQNWCFGCFPHTEFPMLLSWAGNRTRW
jgi:hypothetical protein